MAKIVYLPHLRCGNCNSLVDFELITCSDECEAEYVRLTGGKPVFYWGYELKGELSNEIAIAQITYTARQTWRQKRLEYLFGQGLLLITHG